VFRRIASVIVADIERGRLRTGERLPSSRALATQLGVNRNTVVAAYEELRSQGWIDIEPARGAFIAPRSAAARPAVSPTPGFDLPAAAAPALPVARPSGMLILLGGVPELRFLPHAELARAYRKALRGNSARRLLDYSDPRGDERLRNALVDLLACTRGIAATADAICVVRGSQDGMYLAARALLGAGDLVAVEELGYPPAWEALRLAGASLLPIPVDDEGLDVDALERRCAEQPVRAVYLTPHHQYPTTVTLSPARRARLLALARRERMIVLEDDYDFDFHYEGRPRLPLASSDSAGVVVYFGTMSKLLAPGLRLGFVVAPDPVIRRIADYRFRIDRQGDHVVERAVAMLIEDGELQTHTRRAQRAYRDRRDRMCDALRREVPALEFSVPAGGMSLWARAPGIDVDGWVERGRAAGVLFQAGRRFALDGGSSDRARIGFAAVDREQLREAVRRLAAALG
jgi:GntR family transcriptional regulator / MocR family aminotransferase